jgi:NO-binding membrane sensor protein with MHYT domain
MNADSTHEYSLILWAAMGLVAVLTGHVSLGWLARARRQASLSLSWRAQLLAAITLATGTCATSILGLTNEILSFPVGYGSVAAPVLWLGAVIVSLPLVAVLSVSRRWWAVALGAVLLTGLTAAMLMGWIWAAGLRPGVRWNYQVLGAAAALMLAGFACALWVSAMDRRSRSSSNEAQASESFMRRGSAVVLGLTLMVGQQIMMGGADLGAQRGSVYRNQVPGTLISLASGALVPLTLFVMAVDLSMRRQRRREGSSGFNPQKRRKRRHKVRTL